jgi:3-deoxy-D-manno-octulosonate 8-phosphate phosphatase (KDO 8-P phosphatase)
MLDSAQLHRRLARVAAVVFDLDGVFTDGGLYLAADGQEMRRFNSRDGLGVKRLIDAGIKVALISGRQSPIVARRMAELGVAEVHQGIHDKGPVFERTVASLGVTEGRTAAVGDDLPDLAMLERAAVGIAPADAAAAVRAAADWVTEAGGGYGAVREIADTILAARGAS